MKALLLAVALLLTLVPAASAEHSLGAAWGGRAPITVSVDNRLTDARLTASLERAMALWSESPHIGFVLQSKGKGKANVVVREIYDEGGSLGSALTYTRKGRITSVIVSINVAYLDYGGPFELDDERTRDHLLCHEMGHALGLAHQPASWSSNSCLWLGGRRTTPDEHDFAMLEELYAK